MLINLASPVNRLHPLAKGLVGWWMCLPGIMGGAKWRDLMSPADLTMGNHGTLTNIGNSATSGWGPTNRPGGYGEMRFDGTDDYVNIDTPASLNTLQVPMTIAGWVKPTVVTSTRTLFSQYSATTSSRLIKLVRFDAAVLAYYCSKSDGGFQVSSHSTPVVVGIWQFVTVTVSGSIASPQIVIGLNGVEQSFTPASALSSSPDGTVNIRIGSSQAAGEYGWGALDCWFIYNRALGIQERSWLYQNSCQGCPGLLGASTIKYFLMTPAASGNRRRRALISMSRGGL